MTTIARMNNKVNQNIVTWLKTAIGALSKAERSQALVRMKDDNLVDLFPLTDEKALAFYDVLINREIKVGKRIQKERVGQIRSVRLVVCFCVSGFFGGGFCFFHSVCVAEKSIRSFRIDGASAKELSPSQARTVG
jgi:hypothetical protein